MAIPTVRVSAFPANWLATSGSFADSRSIIWSTGKRIRRGDIQVFAVSSTLGSRPDLASDPRRDSVHSIWRALTPPLKKYRQGKWPTQAKFERLVELRHPVPKADLINAGLLKSAWPRNSAGKIFRRSREVNLLAAVLIARNPSQKAAIRKALHA
jgi:hypothetical protein